jgi:hypothetical protein
MASTSASTADLTISLLDAHPVGAELTVLPRPMPPNAAVEPPRDALYSAQQAHNAMARLLRARVDV